jgi:hypothetical protein
MPLASPLQCPNGVTPEIWRPLLKLSPGKAAAMWLSAHEGAELEEEGPNRGKLLRRWLPTPAAVDGLPYCARLLLAVLDAAGAERVAPKGKHWFWHGGRVATLERGHKENGTWAGPQVEPRAGWLVFHKRRGDSDAGPGGHVDICVHYEPGDRFIEVVGANVSDTIKRRQFRLGHPTISGFGAVRRARR